MSALGEVLRTLESYSRATYSVPLKLDMTCTFNTLSETEELRKWLKDNKITGITFKSEQGDTFSVEGRPT